MSSLVPGTDLVLDDLKMDIRIFILTVLGYDSFE